MLGMGTTLTFNDFTAVLRRPAQASFKVRLPSERVQPCVLAKSWRAPAARPAPPAWSQIGLGAALQYTIMPTLGLIATRIFDLSPAMAAGIILVSCCPGGTASNIVTYIARADLALSVLMTTASTFLAVFATPLLTKALVGTLVPVDAWGLFASTVQAGTGLLVPTPSFVPKEPLTLDPCLRSSAQVVLAPVVLGVLLNRYFPEQVARVAVISPLIASLTVALICASVVGRNAATVMLAGPTLLLSLLFLHSGGFTLGYAASKALGLPERTARRALLLSHGLLVWCRSRCLASPRIASGRIASRSACRTRHWVRFSRPSTLAPRLPPPAPYRPPCTPCWAAPLPRCGA